MAAVRALAAAVALNALLLTAGCGGGEDTTVVGDMVRGRAAELQGTKYSVLVPSGELTFTISNAQRSISAGEAAGGRQHVAPSGVAWVGLDWRLSSVETLDPFQRTLMTEPTARTTITLTTDGTVVPLGDAQSSTSTPPGTRTSGVVYVAVDPDTAPEIEVTVDGVTTRVDTGTGQVEGEQVDALADLATPLVAVCPALSADEGMADVACSYSVTHVPYLGGRGWSDRGWTAAQIVTRVDTFELAAGTYAVKDVADSSSLAGGNDEPTLIDERFTSLVTQVVAEGHAKRLNIVRTLTGVLTDGRGPDDATITVRGTIRLD